MRCSVEWKPRRNDEENEEANRDAVLNGSPSAALAYASHLAELAKRTAKVDQSNEEANRDAVLNGSHSAALAYARHLAELAKRTAKVDQ